MAIPAYPIRYDGSKLSSEWNDDTGNYVIPLEILPFGFNGQVGDLAQIALVTSQANSGVLIKSTSNGSSWTLSEDHANSGYYLSSDLTWSPPPGTIIVNDEETNKDYIIKLYSPGQESNTYSSNTLFYNPSTKKLSAKNITSENITISGNLVSTGKVIIDGDLLVKGNTTNIDLETLTVKDAFINIRTGDNLLADDGGLQINLTTDSNGNVTSSKTFKWNNKTQRFQVNNTVDYSTIAVNSDKLSFFSNTLSQELLNIIPDATGNGYLVFSNNSILYNPTIKLSNQNLVSNLNSDLLDGQHGSYYTSANNLTGGIPDQVLANSNIYIGNTAIALNRKSGELALSGIELDNPTIKLSNQNLISNLNSELLNGKPETFYTSANNLTGVIPNQVLANSNIYIGNTAIALNRKSGELALSGIELDNPTIKLSATTFTSNLDSDLLDGQHGSYYTSANNLTGGIPDQVLANSNIYIGNTAIALNRKSGELALSGIELDNPTIKLSNQNLISNLNSELLNGKPETFYTSANNLTGTLSNDRLSNIPNSKLANSSIIIELNEGLSGGGVVQLGSTVNITPNIASTIIPGIVRLNDTTTSSNVSLAATANSVKTVYDLAYSANINAANASFITTGTLPNDRLSNIPNSKLANSSIIIALNEGLSGGGVVQLGSTVNITPNIASTIIPGIVRLNDTTTSSNVSLAATANSVKTVYDLAYSANINAANASFITTGTLPNDRLSNIPNSKLANNFVTVSTGTGLRGGGIITLGSGITLNVDVANVDIPGIVRLNDTTTSSSVSLAATANSVKTVYDLLDTKLNLTGGEILGNLIIDGNLLITGSYVSVTDKNIADNFLILRSGNSVSPSDGGIQINLSTSPTGATLDSRTIKWNSFSQAFELTNDGTNFYKIITENNKSSVQNYGIVKLTDSVNDSSVILAATANSVKTTYDLAYIANTNLTNLVGSLKNLAYTDLGSILVDSVSNNSTILAATANSVKTTYDLAYIANTNLTNLVGSLKNLAYTDLGSILVDSVSNNSTILAATANSVKTTYDLAYSTNTNLITLNNSLGDLARKDLGSILVDSVSNNSTILAATANSVKTVYDLAYSTNTNLITLNNSLGDLARRNLGSILVDSVSNNSTILAATANSVKIAYDLANTKLNTSGGTIGGNLRINGDLVVSGNTVSLNAQTLSVKDNIIELRAGNSIIQDDGGIQINLTTDSNGVVQEARSIKWTNNLNKFQLTNDGSNYYDIITSHDVGSINNYGLLKLEDSISSNSTNFAATANSVKLAYDTSVLAYNKANNAYIKLQDATSLIGGTINVKVIGTNSSYANSNTFLSGDNTWKSIDTGVNISNDMSSNSSFYPILAKSSANGYITQAAISSEKLYFNPLSGTFSAANLGLLSDSSLKENVLNLTQSIDILRLLRPVSFTWKDNGNKSYGLIAQEVEQILPEVVINNDNGIKSVNYSAIIAFLIDSIVKLADKK